MPGGACAELGVRPMSVTRRAITLVGTLLTMMGGVAPANAANTYTVYDVDPVTVFDSAGSVAATDGAGPYRDATVGSEIKDRKVFQGGLKDYIFLHVPRSKGRTLKMYVPGFVESAGQPLACEIGQVQFISQTDPDFYNTLTAAGSGSVAADGVVRCYSDRKLSNGWVVSWANHPSECAQITRSATKVWTTSATPGCPASLWRISNGATVTPPAATLLDAPVLVEWQQR